MSNEMREEFCYLLKEKQGVGDGSEWSSFLFMQRLILTNFM